MSVFTAKKLKETRNEAHLTQDEVANALKMSVRELILESYVGEQEEQVLCNR